MRRWRAGRVQEEERFSGAVRVSHRDFGRDELSHVDLLLGRGGARSSRDPDRGWAGLAGESPLPGGPDLGWVEDRPGLTRPSVTAPLPCRPGPPGASSSVPAREGYAIFFRR